MQSLNTHAYCRMDLANLLNYNTCKLRLCDLGIICFLYLNLQTNSILSRNIVTLLYIYLLPKLLGNHIHCKSQSDVIFHSRDWDSWPPAIFHGQSMTQIMVCSNDLVLVWCQWLLQVRFTFIVEKVLEVEVI